MAVSFKYGGSWHKEPQKDSGISSVTSDGKTTKYKTEDKKKSSKDKPQRYKPQTEETIKQLESGELKSSGDAYIVGGEVALSKKTAEIVAEAKRQEQEQRQKKQREEMITQAQEITRVRHTAEWERKKIEAEEEKRTKAYDVTQPAYTPERIKSMQETIDVTTQPDWKQYVKFETRVPEAERETDTFRGQPKVTREEVRKKVKWDWRHPIVSAREKSEAFETSLVYKEQELLAGTEAKQKRTTTTTDELTKVSKSTESIAPQEFQATVERQTRVEEASRLGVREVVLASTVPVFYGIAKGTKAVFIDAPLHLKETLTGFVMMPFELPGYAKQVAKETLVNPLGTPAKVITELTLWGKVTKAGMRIAKPKVTEIPIRAKEVSVLETTRKTETGKIVKDTQIQIETVEGKPRVRKYYEPSKIKPVKSIELEALRKTRQSIKPGETRYTETAGEVKARLKLVDEGKKAKLEVKEYTEVGKPKEITDLDTAMTGKLPTGTPLTGATPKLISKPKLEVTATTRKGYEYRQTPKVDGIYKEGEFIVIVKKGKVVKVPEKTIIRKEFTTDKLYKGKIIEGELLAETQYTGKIVKRKYEKKPETIKPEPGRKPEPEFEITLGKEGKIKKVVDLKSFQVTESGKVVQIGRKPITPAQERVLQKIGGRDKQVLIQKLTTEKISPTTTRPVIDVIVKGEKVKGMPALVTETETKTKEVEIVKPVIKVREEQAGKEKLKPMTESRYTQLPKSKIIPEIMLREEQLPESKVRPVSDVKVEEMQRVRTIPVSELKFEQDKVTMKDTFVERTTKIIVPPYIPEEEIKTEEREEQGFNVYMYEEDKQVKANQEPLPVKEANRLGRDIADNSLSASYKVTKADVRVKASKRSRLATGFNVSQDKFRASKSPKRRGFVVEKKRYRLDSVGERRGIKASKLIAERKKSLGLGSKKFKKWRL